MGAFEDLIAQDGFVEHAKFGGNRYGTSKITIEEQTAKGKVVLLDIEMEVWYLMSKGASRLISASFAYSLNIGCQADKTIHNFSTICFRSTAFHRNP